jgi:hypothetical protein
MCFEILGFDVMLDHNLNPVILEVPSILLRSTTLPVSPPTLLSINTSRKISSSIHSKFWASTNSGNIR